jgi:hypothetical protein
MSAAQRLQNIVARVEETKRKRMEAGRNQLIELRRECGNDLHTQVQGLLASKKFDAVAEEGQRSLLIPALTLLKDKCRESSAHILQEYAKSHPRIDGVSVNYSYEEYYSYGQLSAEGLKFSW